MLSRWPNVQLKSAYFEYFTYRSKAVPLSWILLCDLFFMYLFVIMSLLFLAALYSPAGKGLTSWLSCVRCFLVLLSLSPVDYLVRCGT